MRKQKVQTISLPAGVSISPRLMALCDILNESAAGKGDLKLFVPDEHLIRAYALKEVSGEYWVSGYITVSSGFSAENAVTAKGGMIAPMAKDIYTYSIPLQDLNMLLHLPGIIEAECARPVKPTLH